VTPVANIASAARKSSPVNVGAAARTVRSIAALSTLPRMPA
jgi:hypothetical protein